MANAKNNKSFNKSVKIYFSMLKKMPNSLTRISSSPVSSGLLSACKYPKTPSFAANRTATGTATAATLSDVDRFLHENFRTLYPPPSATTSPEQSSQATSSGEMAAVAGKGVAVTTFSKDPYEDFRRSMEDMMEGRHVERVGPLDWDFMEELLLCYLELNERCMHKYILRAFTNLTASFRRREEEEKRSKVPARRRKSVRTKTAAAAAGEVVPAGR